MSTGTQAVFDGMTDTRCYGRNALGILLATVVVVQGGRYSSAAPRRGRFHRTIRGLSRIITHPRHDRACRCVLSLITETDRTQVFSRSPQKLSGHYKPLDLVGALVDLGDRGPAGSLRR
jgi:hypothetical protein